MGIFSKWVESLDYQYEILPSCTRHLSPRSTCEKCVATCSEEAISIIDRKPVINSKKCSECGNCISACPVQAIEGIYPQRTLIQNQIVIKEGKFPTAKELLILYKKGFKIIVGETPELIENWRGPVDKANTILLELGEAPFEVSKKVIKEETVVSRRELFFLWKDEGKSAIRQIAPAKWRFNHKDFHLPRYYKDYQFTRILIDSEKCTLCTACQKLCEKKCFDIKENEFFTFPQNCSSCQLCVDTCPEKAITVEDCISKAEGHSLLLHKKICGTCNKTFTSLREHDEKCVACTKREK